MNVYAIVLDEPNENVWEALKRQWPDHHFVLSDRMMFVARDGISVISSISNVARLHDNNAPGLVLEITTYSGFSRPDLWEWLKKAIP